MSLAILFHLLCAQHVSDINISIFRSLRLCWWITTSVVLFSVRCVLELLVRAVFGGVRFAGWSTTSARTKSSNTQRTENKTTDVVIHQHSRKLLKIDILMSETCWAHNKWNKIASDIKLVFHSSTIAMMQGPINIRNIKNIRTWRWLGKLESQCIQKSVFDKRVLLLANREVTDTSPGTLSLVSVLAQSCNVPKRSNCV